MVGLGALLLRRPSKLLLNVTEVQPFNEFQLKFDSVAQSCTCTSWYQTVLLLGLYKLL